LRSVDGHWSTVNAQGVQRLKEFDAVVLGAIDEALSSLGDSVRQSIYFHLERSFHIKKDEIPCRIGAFARAIEGIFGVGADMLEILIVKKLYEKIGESSAPNVSKTFSFAEHVNAAESCFQQRNRIKTMTELIEYSKRMEAKC